MRIVGGVAALLLLLSAACSDDPETQETYTAEDAQAPADAERVETPEGDIVYVSESTASVYGECDVIEPHQDDIAGWLGIDPPRSVSDFGVACI